MKNQEKRNRKFTKTEKLTNVMLLKIRGGEETVKDIIIE